MTVAITKITLATSSRSLVGQPLGKPSVRFVLTSPWSDQPVTSCQIDGMPASVGDRVLLTAQPDPAQNGIFRLSYTRGGGGVMVGFFNSAAAGDNSRTADGLSEGEVVFASSGLANKGLWIASVGSLWTPDRTPVYFRPVPRDFGSMQRQVRLQWRLGSRSASGFFGQTGTASGPGVRYRELLGATARSLVSLFVAPPLPPIAHTTDGS